MQIHHHIRRHILAHPRKYTVGATLATLAIAHKFLIATGVLMGVGQSFGGLFADDVVLSGDILTGDQIVLSGDLTISTGDVLIESGDLISGSASVDSVKQDTTADSSSSSKETQPSSKESTQSSHEDKDKNDTSIDTKKEDTQTPKTVQSEDVHGEKPQDVPTSQKTEDAPTLAEMANTNPIKDLPKSSRACDPVTGAKLVKEDDTQCVYLYLKPTPHVMYMSKILE